VWHCESVRQVRKRAEGCAASFLKEGRRHFGVADGVRPFHAGHPRVILEVAGCGETGEVPLEVMLMPVGLAFEVVYE
jgi:hypothetical protein